VVADELERHEVLDGSELYRMLGLPPAQHARDEAGAPAGAAAASPGQPHAQEPAGEGAGERDRDEGDELREHEHGADQGDPAQDEEEARRWDITTTSSRS
jgi:hypothetical protein